ALAEPAPGIDLDLSADSLPHLDLVTPGDSRPPARPELRSAVHPAIPRQVPADHPPPPPKPLSSLGKVAAEAQEQARWEGLLTGLRDIRSAQDRMRWSADLRVRALARLLAVALGALIGVLAAAITRIEVLDANQETAKTIARENSTKQIRLATNNYSSSTVRF